MSAKTEIKKLNHYNVFFSSLKYTNDLCAWYFFGKLERLAELLDYVYT